MAINFEKINAGGISLMANFGYYGDKPLDSRLVIPSLEGLATLIENGAAYEGMIVYDQDTKKTYQVQTIEGVLSYREFGLTQEELNDLITKATTAAMEFKGAAATLPENPARGDMYKVAGENIDIKIDDVDAKLGDSIVYDGEKWFLIPSGDDIEDTWRPVDGVNNDATLKFVDGNMTEAVVAADGTIKFNHATVADPTLLAENEQTRTYITAVETDDYGHITGYKTATENVEDTNTEYTFESQVESSSVYFNVTPDTEGATEQTVYVDAYSKNEADGKFVAKEGYIAYTQDEKDKLAGLANYDDEEVRGLIGDNAQAIEDLETYVGTIPNVSDENGNNKYADLDVIGYINKKAQETLAAASGNSSETAASVKQQLDDYIGENNTRVKAVEDEITAIKDTENGILKQAQNYADGLAGNYDEAGAAAGVKSELGGEIAKKVTAVEGKDLIATSEIERLATLKNYDDTKIKEDISKKVDAETGKSLVSDSEIAKLSGISTGANKVEASTNNGSIKIDGVDTVVYAHPDKHAISDVTGLQEALNGLQAKGDYAAEEHTHTKDDITDFAHTHTKADITDFAHTHTASDITDFATEVAKVKVNEATKATQDGNGKVIADAYAEKATTLAGYNIGDAYTKTETDTAVQGAKDYAKGLVDAIPAQTDYTVTCTDADHEAAEGVPAFKRHTLTQNGQTICTIDIPKELVVEAGSVEEVTEEGKPYDGAKVGDKYIRLVIANQSEPIYVPAKDLVDIYTAKDMTGIEGAEIQVAISNTNEISATLVNGGITEEKLAEGVKTKLNKTWEEAGVAADLFDELANGQVKTNKEAIENITKADGLIAAAKNEAIAEASNQDAVVLAEAQKYTDALAGNVYAKAQTYTQEEVNNLIQQAMTWGSF